METIERVRAEARRVAEELGEDITIFRDEDGALSFGLLADIEEYEADCRTTMIPVETVPFVEVTS